MAPIFIPSNQGMQVGSLNPLSAKLALLSGFFPNNGILGKGLSFCFETVL